MVNLSIAMADTQNESIRQTVEKERKRLLEFIRKRVPSQEDAEDVLQEIFMQLWRNPGAFDASRGNLAPWLAVIARNRALDVLRKRKPQTEIDETTVSVEPDLAADADRMRVAEKVRSTLKQMPAAQRSALEMAYFEGYSHSEISQKTGEPLGTIKTRIRTGLIMLRKAVEIT